MAHPHKVHQTVLEFLDSTRSRIKPATRCRCGSIMEYKDITFFYNNRTWEARILFCPECSLIPQQGASYDA
jgi:hypothetical protein